MQKEKFVKLYAKLCDAYGKDFKEGQALVYFEYLGGCGYDELKKAIDLFIVDSSPYMPTVGQLIEKMRPIDAGSAWQRVLDVVRGGGRQWKKLSDLDIATVSAIGGMNDIQNATDENLHFILNNFLKTYPIMAKREIKFGSDNERLKALNMVPETYLFIKRTEELEEIELPKKMLDKIGEKL